MLFWSSVCFHRPVHALFIWLFYPLNFEHLFYWPHLLTEVFPKQKQLWRVPSLHVLYFLLGWALCLPSVSFLCWWLYCLFILLSYRFAWCHKLCSLGSRLWGLGKYLRSTCRIHFCGGGVGGRVRQRGRLGYVVLRTKPDPRVSWQSCPELGWEALAFLPLHRPVTGKQAALREGVCYWQGSFLQLMLLGNWGMSASVQKRVSGWHNPASIH